MQPGMNGPERDGRLDVEARGQRSEYSGNTGTYKHIREFIAFQLISQSPLVPNVIMMKKMETSTPTFRINNNNEKKRCVSKSGNLHLVIHVRAARFIILFRLQSRRSTRVRIGLACFLRKNL